MKIKYIGETFGALSLTNNTVYKCLGIENGLLRIIDDSGDSYLYSAINPRPLDGSSKGGKWVIVEDDENNTLAKVL